MNSGLKRSLLVLAIALVAVFVAGGAAVVRPSHAAPRPAVLNASFEDGSNGAWTFGTPSMDVAIQLLREDGRTEIVSPKTRFHTGDRIRLLVRSSADGFLYALNTATSGREQSILPNQRINGGDNFIAAGKTVRIPENGWFEMRPPSGTERLTLILTDRSVGDDARVALRKAQGTRDFVLDGDDGEADAEQDQAVQAIVKKVSLKHHD